MATSGDGAEAHVDASSVLEEAGPDAGAEEVETRGGKAFSGILTDSSADITSWHLPLSVFEDSAVRSSHLRTSGRKGSFATGEAHEELDSDAGRTEAAANASCFSKDM
mmetsp:Transcript_20818/g.44482  ORF Transcript_20818/g.44482 Transcript_20818/m.44482 type:complete len:108 (+) Transcript_20818:1855-2178(+)